MEKDGKSATKCKALGQSQGCRKYSKSGGHMYSGVLS